jgi:hypothetical protein
MRYVVRVCLPDRPGAIGALASALGAAGADIAALEVIDRSDGVAVDDLIVDTARPAAALRRVAEAVRGTTVEAVTPIGGEPTLTATSLAAAVVEDRAHPLTTLVAGLPEGVGARWAVAVTVGPEGLTVGAASPGAPAVPAGLRLPGVAPGRPRRLPQAAWMPPEWRNSAGDQLELAAAAMGTPGSAVLVARDGGPRFRIPELRRLDELCRIAAVVAAVPAPAPVPV